MALILARWIATDTASDYARADAIESLANTL